MNALYYAYYSENRAEIVEMEKLKAATKSNEEEKCRLNRKRN